MHSSLRAVGVVLPLAACTADSDCQAAWYADADADGHGDPAAFVVACEAPPRHVARVGDCDDASAHVHPGAIERCDGVDNDCDGTVDIGATDAVSLFVDADGDGEGGPLAVSACPGPGTATTAGDCDDGDAAVGPHAPELCNDVDDDCNGAVDDDPLDPMAWTRDLDRDGYGDDATLTVACAAPPQGVLLGGDCDDGDPARHPAAVELCNGVDDDCDGNVDADAVDPDDWYDDADGDSWGAGPPIPGCGPPSEVAVARPGDCDDTDPAIHPDAAEIPADGADQDCDGFELCHLDADGDGAAGPIDVPSVDPACADAHHAQDLGDCDDQDPDIHPNAPETPYDGLDNDCDPLTPDDDLDGDGAPLADDCDDADPAVHPGMEVGVVFVDVTEQAGLLKTHWDGVEHCPWADLQTGAAGVGDIDGDGWLDLFVTRYFKPDVLYLNQQDGTFVEGAAAAGVDFVGSSNGVLMLDIEGDGDLDIYTTSIAREPHRLYVNEGNLTFTEEGGPRGVAVVPPGLGLCPGGHSASAADVDGDGDLDIHATAWGIDLPVPGLARLLMNDGAGFFSDDTDAWELDLTGKASFATSFGDLDGDGDLDAAIAGDWQDTTLWHNLGTRFVEVTGPGLGPSPVSNGMGSDLADIDGDGDLDWFVSAIYTAVNPLNDGNRLYRNKGNGLFADATDYAGLRDVGWGWGAAFFDYDNDSHLDLIVANGYPSSPHEEDATRLFHNDGTGRFDDVACISGVPEDHWGRTVLPFDMDNDGDLDVLIVSAGVAPRLLRNDGGDDLDWLRVELRDGPPNTHAVGATVWVRSVEDGPVQRRDVHLNSNYGGIRNPEAHFGLGDLQGSPVFEVRVVWPDGTEQVLGDVQPDQHLVLVHP